jgi:hypothetical protein
MGCVCKFRRYVNITKTGYCIYVRQFLFLLTVFIKTANENKINFSASSDFSAFE